MPRMRPVEKLAKCNRCGDEQIAWVESKSGKHYLVDAYKDNTGQLWANPVAFHSRKCGKKPPVVSRAVLEQAIEDLEKQIDDFRCQLRDMGLAVPGQETDDEDVPF